MNVVVETQLSPLTERTSLYSRALIDAGTPAALEKATELESLLHALGGRRVRSQDASRTAGSAQTHADELSTRVSETIAALQTLGVVFKLSQVSSFVPNGQSNEADLAELSSRWSGCGDLGEQVAKRVAGLLHETAHARAEATRTASAAQEAEREMVVSFYDLQTAVASVAGLLVKLGRPVPALPKKTRTSSSKNGMKNETKATGPKPQNGATASGAPGTGTTNGTQNPTPSNGANGATGAATNLQPPADA